MIDNDYGCIGIESLLIVLGMVYKNDITGDNAMDFIDAAYTELRVTDKGTMESFGKFG